MNLPPDNAVPPPVAVPARKNRTWIVFFLLLALLAGLGILVPLVYNLSLQLKAQDVAAAHELWRRAGPADYDLEYMTKIDRDEPLEFRVGVRSGKVQWVTSPNEIVLTPDTYELLGSLTGSALQRYTRVEPGDGLTRRHTPDAFFALLESKLREDVAVGGRNYATALFDRKDGHPLRYIHRVRGTSERLELNVRLLPVHKSVGEK